MREQFSISLVSILPNSVPLPQTYHTYQVLELSLPHFCYQYFGSPSGAGILSISGYMLQVCPSQELELFIIPQ